MRTKSRNRISRRIMIQTMALAIVPLLFLAAYAYWQMRALSLGSLQSLPRAEVLAIQHLFLRGLLFALLPLVALIGALAYRLSRGTAQPLRQITSAARSLARGDLDTALPTDVQGELGALLVEIRQNLRAQADKLAALDRAGRIITSSLDLGALLDDMANQLADVARATGCLIILLDPDSQQPVPMAAYGEYYDDYRNIALHAGEGSAACMAMASGQPLVIPDVANSDMLVPRLSRAWPDQALLVLPLVVKERSIGAALVGDNRGARDFYPEEVDRAMGMARQMAVAINNAQLYESSQRHLHNLSLLYETSAATSSTLDEQTILEMAVHAFSKVFEVSCCQLVILDGARRGHLVSELRPPHWPKPQEAHLPLADHGLIAWIRENQRPLALREAERNPLFSGYAQIMGIPRAQAALVAPLMAKDALLGMIILIAEGKARQFTAEEMSLAQTLANQIASVVQNARLYGQMVEEKRKFELAALSMVEGLIILDPQDALLFANPQAQATLGLQSPLAPGISLADLCPDPQLLGLLGRRDLAGEGVVSGEMRVGEGDLAADDRDLNVSMAPVRDEDGQLQWWVVVIHDITHLKEVDRLKSDFISTVSHELRTPLASIMGFSEMLLTRQPGPLTDVQEEFVSIIFDSSELLLDLVNDLLDVSRIESGRLRLQLRQIEPMDVLNRVLAAMQPLARQKALDLRLEASPELGLLMADPRRLEQVLTNLVHNAYKFTPEEGRVTITASQKGDGLCFSVADTGIGIPPEDMDKLFTKFYRGDQVVQGAMGGTGLGLYIAKNIIIAHGGEIGVESELGQGTTVCFTLPAWLPTVSQGTPTEDMLPNAQDPYR